MPGDHIKFDFLGKDSIRYENEVVVHPKVYQLIKKFCQQFANKKGNSSAYAAGATLVIQDQTQTFTSYTCLHVSCAGASLHCAAQIC